MRRRPPRYTRTDTLVPYTTLFRSLNDKKQYMNIDRVDSGRDVPNDFNVIIEIPAHADPVKYEVDKETGALFVDRFLSTPMRRSEEHTSELQSLMRISYAVFCLKKKSLQLCILHLSIR